MAEEYIESDLILPGAQEESKETPIQEEDLDIEVVDDTPQEDRRPPRDETREAAPQNEEDELKNYSEGTRKRIKRLKYEFHEERRQRERADREKQEALNYAAALQQQVEVFRQQNEASQRALIHTTVKQKGSDLDAAKRNSVKPTSLAIRTKWLRHRKRSRSLPMKSECLKHTPRLPLKV